MLILYAAGMKRAWLVLALVCGCGGGGGTITIPAGIDPNALDNGVDRCTDFYQWACGNWLATHPIGSDGSIITRESQAFYATESAERTLLAGASSDPNAQLLRAFNGACLAGSDARAPLDQALAQIAAAQPGASLAATVAALHDDGAAALFSFGGTRDLMQPVNVIAAVGSGGTGLPREYYVDATNASVIAAYRQHVTKLSSLLGVNDAAMPDAVVNVETALAQAQLTPDQLRDPTQTYHVEPLSALTQAVPDFDFASYFSAEGAPQFSSLNVTVPTFFTALEQVLTQTSAADLKRYLSWRAMEAFAGTLGDTVVAEEYRFHEGTFAGFTQPLPRNEYCLRQTVAALAWPMSKLYADQRGTAPGFGAQPIVARLEQALKDDLAGVAWLDDATRAQALAKLAALDAEISAPSDFGPYVPQLASLPPDFAGASAALRQHERARSLALIGTQNTRRWFMSPITVNAAYSPTLNAINLPVAILQVPRFDPSFEDVVNFGALGTLVGHELTHGFDDEGRKFDASGALRDWWTPSVKTQFDARAQCLVAQYGAIQPLPGVSIDGQLTLGENIADVAGVKLAYAALAPSTAPREANNFSNAELFFIAYAQAWCENERPEALASSLTTDPHSPASARVNAVLADTPEFAAAFGCPPGTPLAPTQPCAVW
jgi:endothelin-converting enzyme/putative endopeptidase